MAKKPSQSPTDEPTMANHSRKNWREPNSPTRRLRIDRRGCSSGGGPVAAFGSAPGTDSRAPSALDGAEPGPTRAVGWATGSAGEPVGASIVEASAGGGRCEGPCSVTRPGRPTDAAPSTARSGGAPTLASSSGAR